MNYMFHWKYNKNESKLFNFVSNFLDNLKINLKAEGAHNYIEDSCIDTKIFCWSLYQYQYILLITVSIPIYSADHCINTHIFCWSLYQYQYILLITVSIPIYSADRCINTNIFCWSLYQYQYIVSKSDLWLDEEIV